MHRMDNARKRTKHEASETLPRLVSPEFYILTIWVRSSEKYGQSGFISYTVAKSPKFELVYTARLHLPNDRS